LGSQPERFEKLYLLALPHLSIDQVKVNDIDSDKLKDYEQRIAALEKEK